MQFNWKKIEIKNNSNDKKLLSMRACPICQHEHASTVLTLTNFQFFSDSDLHEKQATLQEQMCDKCNAIFLNPCYNNVGFDILFAEAGQSYGSTLQRPQEQFNWIKKRIDVDGSNFMDIGCGTGNFIASLPESINKIGIDIDQQSIDTAKKNNPNVEFICSPFETIEYKKQLDIITMFHVLEHVQDPLNTLKRLHTLATKETRFIVEVPIIENGLTNDINGFFSAQHLTHFSRNSFKNILALSGWEVIEWQEQPDYNGCRVLAKKGAHKQALTFDGQQKYYLHRYLQNWYSSIMSAENKLQQIKHSQCVIWGGGMHLEFIYQISSLFQHKRKFLIVDKDPNKQGKLWRGIEIHDPSILSQLPVDKTQFIVSSYGNQETIKEALLQCKIKPEDIITLYDNIHVY